jgi:nucleoid DNA-binding protein
MEEHIITLLNINLRVIIPEFGAFIVRQKEPRIIVFNEFLRFNDGLLINHIVKADEIEADVAAQRVSEFVHDLIKALDAGKTVSFKGLGNLKKDAGGKITYQDNDSETAIKPLKTTDKPVKNSDKLAKAADKPVKETHKPVKVKDHDEMITLSDDKADFITDKEAGISDSAAEVESEKKTIRDKAKTTSKETEKKAEPPVVVHEPAGRRKRTEIVLFILLFLVANALIIAYFVFGRNKGLSDKDAGENLVSDTVVQQEPLAADLSEADSSVVLDGLSEAEPLIEANLVNDTSRYYIVAGCFRDESNADELVKSLLNKGYKAEKFGKIGNLYAVSFASFSDKEAAMKELQNIRGKISVDAWMTSF